MSKTTDLPIPVPRTFISQRRSVSLGDSPLATSADDEPAKPIDNGIIDYTPYITKCNEDDYVCAPLPHCNNRPKAKTCWLVFALPIFPCALPLPSVFRKRVARPEDHRSQICFSVIDKRKHLTKSLFALARSVYTSS
jgi:hypothetical protein